MESKPAMEEKVNLKVCQEARDGGRFTFTQLAQEHQGYRETLPRKNKAKTKKEILKARDILGE